MTVTKWGKHRMSKENDSAATWGIGRVGPRSVRKLSGMGRTRRPLTRFNPIVRGRLVRPILDSLQTDLGLYLPDPVCRR